jgi:hypothetical protein
MGSRTMPSARAALRAAVPVDSSGLDPEMASTIGGERARVLKQKMTYAPASVAKPAAPAKKKVGGLMGFINKIRGK